MRSRISDRRRRRQAQALSRAVAELSAAASSRDARSDRGGGADRRRLHRPVRPGLSDAGRPPSRGEDRRGQVSPRLGRVRPSPPPAGRDDARAGDPQGAARGESRRYRPAAARAARPRGPAAAGPESRGRRQPDADDVLVAAGAGIRGARGTDDRAGRRVAPRARRHLRVVSLGRELHGQRAEPVVPAAGRRRVSGARRRIGGAESREPACIRAPGGLTSAGARCSI